MNPGNGMQNATTPASPARAMHAARRVAVVGGGWAGMAAAVELAARGMQVAVFEAGKLLG
jgi:NADPH-dependent 2,4-dienoyl-CoA reductase/sulfur reductase-like enzyme